MTLMTSGLIQRQVWRPFHKTSSKLVLKGGLVADIGAKLPKGKYFEGDHSGIQQWGMYQFYRNEFANFIVRPLMCVCIFRISVTKIQFALKSETNNVHFTWRPIHTFLIVSRSPLLRMRNVTNQIVEKIKTHILCPVTFFVSKIVTFMRLCVKTLHCRTDTDENMAHANCMLDT